MRLLPAGMQDRGRALAGRAWRQASAPTRRVGAVLLVLLLLYGAWPYVTLWSLHLAVMRDDRAALASLVDIEAVREQIARRLNKERDTLIGDVSDAFVAWLEAGIRRSGPRMLHSWFAHFVGGFHNFCTHIFI